MKRPPPATSGRIDSHVHLLPERLVSRGSPAWADPWFQRCHAGPSSARPSDPGGIVAALDRAGFDRAVVMGWPFSDPELCRVGNEEVAQAVRDHPARIIGLATVNPSRPGWADELDRAAALGLTGVGELNHDAQGFGLEPGGELHALLDTCAARDWPVLLHASEPVGHDYPGKGTAHPGRLWPLLEAVLVGAQPPRLCLAHLGGGLPLYGHMPEVRELCRRLWFDCAALPLLYRPGAASQVGRLCGWDRLLLGSDFPRLTLERYRPFLETLAATARGWVEGGSALSWLGRSATEGWPESAGGGG
ncbi:MAG TPA: amidohydrolase family protein [Candidatus Micrarchaeia archaeon]|nr:amidohydrolase family protein [Candidatus Micrarchaeia archaeon]